MTDEYTICAAILWQITGRTLHKMAERFQNSHDPRAEETGLLVENMIRACRVLVGLSPGHFRNGLMV
jgi:hypothetical protein